MDVIFQGFHKLAALECLRLLSGLNNYHSPYKFKGFHTAALTSLSGLAIAFKETYLSENNDFKNETNDKVLNFTVLLSIIRSIVARFLNKYMRQVDILLLTNGALLFGS